MADEPAIDAIRRVRRGISREVGHDLHCLKDTFEELERQFERPPVHHGQRRAMPDAATAESNDVVTDQESPPRK